MSIWLGSEDNFYYTGEWCCSCYTGECVAHVTLESVLLMLHCRVCCSCYIGECVAHHWSFTGKFKFKVWLGSLSESFARECLVKDCRPSGKGNLNLNHRDWQLDLEPWLRNVNQGAIPTKAWLTSTRSRTRFKVLNHLYFVTINPSESSQPRSRTLQAMSPCSSTKKQEKCLLSHDDVIRHGTVTPLVTRGQSAAAATRPITVA